MDWLTDEQIEAWLNWLNSGEAEDIEEDDYETCPSDCARIYEFDNN